MQVRRVIAAVFGDEHRFGVMGNYGAPMLKLARQLSNSQKVCPSDDCVDPDDFSGWQCFILFSLAKNVVVYLYFG